MIISFLTHYTLPHHSFFCVFLLAAPFSSKYSFRRRTSSVCVVVPTGRIEYSLSVQEIEKSSVCTYERFFFFLVSFSCPRLGLFFTQSVYTTKVVTKFLKQVFSRNIEVKKERYGKKVVVKTERQRERV